VRVAGLVATAPELTAKQGTESYCEKSQPGCSRGSGSRGENAWPRPLRWGGVAKGRGRFTHGRGGTETTARGTR